MDFTNESIEHIRDLLNTYKRHKNIKEIGEYELTKFGPVIQPTDGRQVLLDEFDSRRLVSVSQVLSVSKHCVTILGQRILGAIFEDWLVLRAKQYCIHKAQIFIEIIDDHLTIDDDMKNCKVALRINRLHQHTKISTNEDFDFIVEVLKKFTPMPIGFKHLMECINRAKGEPEANIMAIFNHPACMPRSVFYATIQTIVPHLYKLNFLINRDWVNMLEMKLGDWKDCIPKQDELFKHLWQFTTNDISNIQGTIRAKMFDSIFGSFIIARHAYCHFQPLKSPEEVSRIMFTLLGEFYVEILHNLHLEELNYDNENGLIRLQQLRAVNPHYRM